MQPRNRPLLLTAVFVCVGIWMLPTIADARNQAQHGVVIATPFDSAKVAAHFFSLGYDYAEQSDYLVAAEMYRGGLKFDPNNAQARYQLGEALERLGDHQEEALAEYRIARELNPDSDTGSMVLTRMVRLQQS